MAWHILYFSHFIYGILKILNKLRINLTMRMTVKHGPKLLHVLIFLAFQLKLILFITSYCAQHNKKQKLKCSYCLVSLHMLMFKEEDKCACALLLFTLLYGGPRSCI